MRSLLVQGQFCLFVFYPECLWNLLKHFTSSFDRLQLHNGVVTFSKCLRETWDCRSDGGGGGGGVSGRGQRRDEKLREWRYAASPHDEASKSEPDSPQASQKHSSSDVFHSGHWNMFDLLVLLQHRAVNQINADVFTFRGKKTCLCSQSSDDHRRNSFPLGCSGLVETTELDHSEPGRVRSEESAGPDPRGRRRGNVCL